ncbi:MAG: TolC family protein [Shimia sp.]
MTRRLTTGFMMVVACGMLAGCLSVPQMPGRGDAASAVETPPPAPEVATRAANTLAQPEPSATIESLIARRSVLTPGSPYATVAGSVMAAGARAAEADLRAARLRADAADKNWLPKIGPSITLSSMGDLVTGLLVEAVLFDNGRLKAERAFAAADVEVAAVTLSEDANGRVRTALTLFLRAEQAREAARVQAVSRDRMRHFASIMRERVDGGVSDTSDLFVIQGKLREAEDQLATDRETAATALAELNAMADRDLSGLTGAGAPGAAAPGTALAVEKARAVGAREVARARVQRAEMLPGLSVGGRAGENANIGLEVSSEALVGLGQGGAFAALTAAQDGARRRVVQAEEDAERTLRRLTQELAALERQEAQKADLARAARRNHAIFQEQFESGGRSIMDVIGVYETAQRLEREFVQVKYDRARVQIEIAALYGALVDGAAI